MEKKSKKARKVGRNSRKPGRNKRLTKRPDLRRKVRNIYKSCGVTFARNWVTRKIAKMAKRNEHGIGIVRDEARKQEAKVAA